MEPFVKTSHLAAALALSLAARTFAARTFAATTILFDNTKAEQAGNADWVIDGNARFPTPAASTVTPSTPENYWTGALSSWGIAAVKSGYGVETLPTSGRITYGDSTNAQDLSHYQVYVVDEPNIAFTAAEKTAILTFVQNGGGLFMISDHVGSDRNNDGIDSVGVWNDLLSNNTIKINPFGISYNNSSNTDITINSSFVDTTTSDPITHGTAGAVSTFDYNDGDTMTINTTNNASAKAAVWFTSAHSSSTVMAAYATYGLGRVVAVADSSPADDGGTGASGNTLFNGWGSDSDAALFLNGTNWLATPTATPEPASLTLLLLASPMLLLRKRKNLDR